MTPHDAAAVHRCLHGEPQAFGEILERYKDRIFSLILRMVGNPSDAEDLAQDAFIKAFRRLDSYDPSRPLLTWLFKIAHNTTLDFLRAKRPQALSIDDEEPLELEDRAQSPEAAVDSRLQEAFIDRLLEGLPPLYREAVLLRHQEELDLKQIAAVLGLPEGTVKIRLFRARDLLRRALEKSGFGDETESAGNP